MEAQQEVHLSDLESQLTTTLNRESSARGPVQTSEGQSSQHDMSPPRRGSDDDLEMGATAQAPGCGTAPETEDHREKDKGHIGMSVLQGTDPSCRFFAPRAEAASVVQLLMDQKIWKFYNKYCDAVRDENMAEAETASEELNAAVTQCYSFVNSRMGVESLPYPRNSVFRGVKNDYFSNLKTQGFHPPDVAVAWKALRPENRHEEFAKSLLEGGSLQSWLLSCFMHKSVPMDDGATKRFYKVQDTRVFVTVLFSLVVGIVFCVPIVLLGLDFLPRESRVALIVVFILAFGCTAAWWFREPSWAVAVMIAYAAALVSVDLGGG